MTAINAWAAKDSATVYTDGAWIGDDGRLLWIAPKVVPLPHMNACMVVRGNSQTIHVLQSHLPSLFTSFDQAVRDVGPLILNPPPNLRAAMGPKSFNGWQLMLLGYSEHVGQFAGAFMQGTIEYGEPGWKTEPFVRLLTPLSPDLVAHVEPMHGDPGASEAGAVMDRQRRILNTDPAGVPGYVVGGFCQRTHITREGITTSIVRRWPDKIGEPIAGPIKAQGSVSDPFRITASGIPAFA
ncbi:hypothetical protein [Methylobacterium sp. E-045]|uniref:hypothetical protein n=1 Tax=Methylobacterium sp. E-045 TaxID=2836575 RepID=UPI001FBAA5E2|nr:hypothetical protein [Methylobacterium sp. E-045]MCJ2131581.1 hypothetical protein [Methylobacterium sp. E-045]